jgi:uncharacterized membrane protein YdbT with pleckstrin-like domain
MAYPRRLLADGEEVQLDLHPHVRVLARPVLVLLVVVPLASFVAAKVPPGAAQAPVRAALAALALLLLLALVLRPFLGWVTTRYVVTDRRLITRRGVLARSGRDVPLSRITDVSFEHGLLERILGCGTLVVDCAGERGQVVLADVPGVEAVQRRLHELADELPDDELPDDELPDDELPDDEPDDEPADDEPAEDDPPDAGRRARRRRRVRST